MFIMSSDMNISCYCLVTFVLSHVIVGGFWCHGDSDSDRVISRDKWSK